MSTFKYRNYEAFRDGFFVDEKCKYVENNLSLRSLEIRDGPTVAGWPQPRQAATFTIRYVLSEFTFCVFKSLIKCFLCVL